MELQNREPYETTIAEDYEEPFVSENFVKSALIGAILGGVGFLLYRYLTQAKFHHVIPPIIIRSDETTPEPIEIETERVLTESAALSGQSVSPLLGSKVYRMSGFGLTKYVVVYRAGGNPSSLTPYRSSSGFEVKMWLQHKQGTQWQNEPGQAHLVVKGTSSNFALTCEQLLADKPNANPFRPRKRSFNKNKKWRIWKVQVGSNPEIELGNYEMMEIRFDDHY